MSVTAAEMLARIRALPLPSTPIKIMNVCGGHERALTHAGLRTVLPPSLQLIPGPGCPVCVCPEEDIYTAMQLALRQKVMLVAFGDMLRVPVNVPKNQARTLEQAKAAGADIRPLASPQEARHLAQTNPQREVVFFVAGFETTIAPVAAMLAEGVPPNLSILLSGRLTWPAVAMLLDSGTPGFDALIAPGHVSAVMGAEEWRFVSAQHHLPCAVAGFTPASLLAAIDSCVRQYLTHQADLDNCYTHVVKAQGNLFARQCLTQVLDIYDANWRGIGVIPASGFTLKAAFAAHDARVKFPTYADQARQHVGKMPPGCDCAQVVLGKQSPDQCKLYGTACTPRTPIGPCMVSDEGACRIWWAGGIRKKAASCA
jgi:hydrogenase expression/formation protein HypD